MLSVVIPARDEAANLPSLIAEVHAALPALSHEIVIVDDGSTDDSLQVLKRLAEHDSSLRIMRHKSSCGQSAALRTGIRAARKAWIATLDGDGQNDPADLPVFWAARPAGLSPEQPWLAIGNRVDRKDSAWRRLLSRVAFAFRRWWLDDDTPDTGCGVKLFGRAAWFDLPWFSHQHRFFPALMRRNGGCVVSLPVRHRPRRAGHSKYTTLGRTWAGIADLKGVAWLIRRNRLPVVDEIR